MSPRVTMRSTVQRRSGNTETAHVLDAQWKYFAWRTTAKSRRTRSTGAGGRRWSQLLSPEEVSAESCTNDSLETTSEILKSSRIGRARYAVVQEECLDDLRYWVGTIRKTALRALALMEARRGSAMNAAFVGQGSNRDPGLSDSCTNSKWRRLEDQRLHH